MNSKEWYKKKYFWDKFETVLFSSRHLEDAKIEVKNIIKLLKAKKKDQILDLCCGVGRHTLNFASLGFKVTGVDLTKGYLEKIKQSAKKENLIIDLFHSDMREFISENKFDIALNLYTSFGYFENSADDERVLNNVYKSLKLKGKFLMEMVGKEVLSRTFLEKDWREEDDQIILEERKISENWDSITSRWILFKSKEKYEQTIKLRLYSGRELSELLKKCGFSNVKLYGDFEGNPYNNNAKRLVAFAQK
jgi:ubiquinone/menaquinone biosynthesis C-methylase UbiE